MNSKQTLSLERVQQVVDLARAAGATAAEKASSESKDQWCGFAPIYLDLDGRRNFARLLKKARGVQAKTEMRGIAIRLDRLFENIPPIELQRAVVHEAAGEAVLKVFKAELGVSGHLWRYSN